MSDVVSLVRRVVNESAYEARGEPAATYEQALVIPTVWIDDEIREAVDRRDLTALNNLGQACFTRYALSSSAHERISAYSGFHRTADAIVRLSLGA